jgi:tetratricopeptide (TPR) repeat protein
MTRAEELLDEGNTELAMGELENAAALYRRSVEEDPSFFDGWQALMMSLVKLGRNEEAIQAGQRAIEILPNDQMAYASLSIAYARNNQIPEAEAMGAKARIISWGGKAVQDAPRSPMSGKA